MAGFSGNCVGVALTSLKPQLAIWIIPYTFGKWWYSDQRKKIVYTSLAIFSFYFIPSLVWSGWWQAWLTNTPSIFKYAEHAASMFGAAALISLPIKLSFCLIATLAIFSLILLKPFSDEKFWNWIAIFNPVSNIYSLCVVIRNIDWIAVGASWLLLPVALTLHTGLPWVVVPVYLLSRSYQRCLQKV